MGLATSLMMGAPLMVATGAVLRMMVGSMTISIEVVLGNAGRSVPMGRTAVASSMPVPVPSTPVEMGIEGIPVPMMTMPVPVPMGAIAVVALPNGALMGSTIAVGEIVPTSPVPVTRTRVGEMVVALT